jgi:hypothetical protein
MIEGNNNFRNIRRLEEHHTYQWTFAPGKRAEEFFFNLLTPVFFSLPSDDSQRDAGNTLRHESRLLIIVDRDSHSK